MLLGRKLEELTLGILYVKQLPVIPPAHLYTPALLDFIVPRVLELTYTAWDLQPFAQDVGYDGAPFVWDEERRFLMRCELDALYFHLYQIARDDVDYILETFPIVKRKDEARSRRISDQADHTGDVRSDGGAAADQRTRAEGRRRLSRAGRGSVGRRGSIQSRQVRWWHIRSDRV